MSFGLAALGRYPPAEFEQFASKAPVTETLATAASSCRIRSRVTTEYDGSSDRD